MIRIKPLLLAFTICLALVPAAFAQDDDAQPGIADQINALHWVEGPQRVSVGDNASFDIPAGYRYLGANDSVKFMELTQNLPLADGGSIFAPDDFRWWGTFEYDDSGHIGDRDDIDADALLASMRETQQQANEVLRQRGWMTLEVHGWKHAPFYDPDSHNLSWATDLVSSDNEETINYNTRLLSRTGYTAATLVVDPATYQPSVDEFRAAIQGYHFNPDATYAAFKPGDKTAEYGLAALVTGGAVAVAAKTGFWKVIVGALAAGWKFVVAAVLAFFAGIRRFFGRSRGRS